MKRAFLLCTLSMSLVACPSEDKCAALSADECGTEDECSTVYGTALESTDEGELCYEDDTRVAVGCSSVDTCTDAIAYARSSDAGEPLYEFDDGCFPADWEEVHPSESALPEGMAGPCPADPGADTGAEDTGAADTGGDEPVDVDCTDRSVDGCEIDAACVTTTAIPLVTTDCGALCFEPDTSYGVACREDVGCDDVLTYAHPTDEDGAATGPIHMFSSSCIPEDWTLDGWDFSPEECDTDGKARSTGSAITGLASHH